MCMSYCRPSRLPSSTITTGDAGDQHVAQRHHAVDNSHDNGPDDADDAFQARSDGVEYSCDLVLLAAFMSIMLDGDIRRIQRRPFCLETR